MSSDGHTRPPGRLSFETGWQIDDDLRLAGRGATWARHDLSLPIAISAAKRSSPAASIPSAPRRLWSADLTWTPGKRLDDAMAARHTG